ncbi:NAD(P)/FAD-dependent oxidoreductase [Cryobacterium sp. 1639]|uniref:NAD(P)/FAD-dependent oxidoreductase n=1 Tax=Cryobacterium inferilacus TaxID=2866629 RepID=UPI001C7328E8|nr:NAD(P)/FAD-dependent oxidoreductase [Cryobacterium sp. 1639]MBX0298686.1 NAD(P)/FAD-dependent oxidoreductase [Cryobacterium sp. 1639]
MVDCVVIGGGPAGLSAALNLARARLSVLVIDSDRPRHAATLISHGFITRDGVPPNELRRLAREEVAGYPGVDFWRRSAVRSVSRPAIPTTSDGTHPFTVTVAGTTPAADRVVHSRTVLVATGLRETLPAVPGIRGFYGMSLFSCVACDGYELNDQPLALIGETDDLYARALLVAQWTSTLTVFTNGSAAVTAPEALALRERGITVERRTITELEGDRGRLVAVHVDGGDRVPVTGGFVRPFWHPTIEFLSPLSVADDAFGHLLTDRDGRTSVPGLYAAGDVAAPGPQQLIVAAGAGARTAAVITHDLLGVTTAH